MPREALAAFLSAETTRTFVLRQEARPVGLCEFDGFGRADMEHTHLGLIPAVHGQRLGPVLLDAGLRAAWGPATRRIRLHTDTDDRPRAMATYARAGFKPYLYAENEAFAD